MKKNLLCVASLLMATVTSMAQVTEINSNKSLFVTVPLNNVKTIVTSELDSTLWVTEGTFESTEQLSVTAKFLNYGGLLNGKFIFGGWTAATGAELFITDGTAGGTALVKDINGGAVGSAPSDFALLNGFLYFTAATATEGRELWRTDGTVAGTTLVKDINAGVTSSNAADEYNLVSNGSLLLFAAAGSASQGVELWKSDGTSAGTTMLKDIYTGADSSKPHDFTLYNNMVLFLAKNAANGEELWKTDGTAANTVLVKDINPGTGSCTSIQVFPGFSFPIAFSSHTFNNKVYFRATDGTSGGQVWVTDGTSGGTTLLKDIVPGINFSSILIFDAVDVAGKFIFPVSDGATASLWQSDGTTGGTSLFKTFSFSSASQLPYIALNYSFLNGNISQTLFQGNKFFFVGGSDTEGAELWISDGTLANTHIVKDINTGAGDGLDFAGNISFMYTASEFFFAANDGVQGNELWRTDGTEANTVIVEDINSGAGDANPQLGVVNNNKIIFSANDGDDAVRTDLFVVNGNFSPLPVRLSSLLVTKNNNDAVLRWITQQEINTNNFVVQRSYDAIHFDNIGTVTAAGNSSTTQEYQFTDAGICSRGNTLIYYRLITIDRDGKMQYSNLVLLKLKGPGFTVQLHSNPVQDEIRLSVTGTSGMLHVAVTDMMGKLVYNSEVTVVNSMLIIPSAGLPHGSYGMVIYSGDEKRTLRFVR